jgi:hypothetical protein
VEIPVLANIADTSHTWYSNALKKWLGPTIPISQPRELSHSTSNVIEAAPTDGHTFPIWQTTGEDTFPFWLYPQLGTLGPILTQVINRSTSISAGLMRAQQAAQQAVQRRA